MKITVKEKGSLKNIETLDIALENIEDLRKYNDKKYCFEVEGYPLWQNYNEVIKTIRREESSLKINFSYPDPNLYLSPQSK